MNRNVWIGSIAVVVVMAIGTVLIVAKGNSSQKAVPEQATAVASALTVSADADVKAQKSQETKKTGKPAVQPSAPAEKKNEAPDIPSMTNEQMMKMYKIQTAGIYAPLFNDLKLDDAKREEFNERMTDFAAKSMGIDSSIPDGASEKDKELRIKSELDADLKDLLGADFPKYEEFRDSMQSRNTVEMLNQSLASEEKLDPEVQKNLVKALTEGHKLYVEEYGDGKSCFPSMGRWDAYEKSRLNKTKFISNVLPHI